MQCVCSARRSFDDSSECGHTAVAGGTGSLTDDSKPNPTVCRVRMCCLPQAVCCGDRFLVGSDGQLCHAVHDTNVALDPHTAREGLDEADPLGCRPVLCLEIACEDHRIQGIRVGPET